MFPKIVDETFENKVLDISHEEYHSRADCVHSSTLKQILISPNAFKKSLENKKIPTKQMINGSILHEAVLEGSKFLARYHVEPAFKGKTKDGKETTSKNSAEYKTFKAEFEASLPPGSIILLQESYDLLRWQLDSVLEHKFAMDIIRECDTEVKKQWRDPVTGLPMISSDDLMSFKTDVWADVKTCSESDWEKFRWSVEDKELNYPFQAAMYEEGNIRVHGKAPHEKYWIAVQNCFPFEVRVHYIDDFYMDVGRYQFQKAKRDLALALKTNLWPQGQQVIEAGEPSSFYKSKYEPLLENQNA